MTNDIIPKSEKRPLKYDFTAVEVHDLSIQLAQKTKELQAVEEEKKAITSQFAARINEIKATTNKLSNQVADGYEYREVECDVEYHKPAQGRKTLTRRDTGLKFDEKMTEWEWNLFNQSDIEESDMIKEERDNLRGKRKQI
jgi:hypothetical protein